MKEAGQSIVDLKEDHTSQKSSTGTVMPVLINSNINLVILELIKERQPWNT